MVAHMLLPMCKSDWPSTSWKIDWLFWMNFKATDDVFSCILFFCLFPVQSHCHRTWSVLSDFSFCLSPSSSAVKIQPIYHFRCQSYSLYLKEEGIVHMEDSGQVVSKSTFRNVSLFYTCSIWASSVLFPTVRKCSLNKTHKLKEEGLAVCATATDRPPLVFLYSKVWRCLLFCIYSFVLLTGRSYRNNWTFGLFFMLKVTTVNCLESR